MSRTRPPARALSFSSRSRSSVVESLEQRQLLSVDISVNTGSRYQTIDGFGTSLGGGTSLNLLKSKGLQKMYWQDLGSSMFRADLQVHVLKAKGGTYATPVYMGPNIQHNIRLMNFSNYDVLINGVMARSALKYGQGNIKIIGSLWTPPHWMKGPEVDPISGKFNGVQPTIDANGTSSGGSLIATPANLTQFGRYVAAYVQGFKQAFGVPLYAISIQNELAFHEPYSSAVYSPKLYVAAVKAVAHWFKVYGITTKLIGPEDVGVGDSNSAYTLKRQMSYINAIRADKEASADIAGYAIHGYAGNGVSTTRSPEMWAQYLNGISGSKTLSGIRQDSKFSWMTETSGGINSWPTAMRMAGNVLDALVQGNVSAWVYWGITADQPSQTGYTLMTNANPKSTRYVAAKHFFKFIRPGAVRVATTGNDPNGIYSAAFVDDSAKTLTTVIANEGAKGQTVSLHVPGTNITDFDIGYESTATKEWVRLKDIKVRNGIAVVTLPAQSILTLQASTAVKIVPGNITGTYFNDTNNNGKKDSGEQALGGDTIYLDLNKNNAYDPGEPKTKTNAKGGFAFVGLAPGKYSVRRDVPANWKLTTDTTSITVKTDTTTAVLIGAKQNGSASNSTASISGMAFNDTDANGVFNTNDSIAVGKTIFLDTNNDGVLESGETSTHTDSNGHFSFTGLQAGTYHVRRVFPPGFKASTPAANITVTSGQTFSNVSIGAKVA